jgi:hypothetical protein
VSKDLLGKEDDCWEAYSKIMERAKKEQPIADVRSLYTFPIFAVEEAGVALSSVPDSADEMQAFEQCLQLYQEGQAGCTVVQSEHGNFLLPINPT